MREDYYGSGDNSEMFTLNPGEIKTFEISLRDYNPKDIDLIFLQSNIKS